MSPDTHSEKDAQDLERLGYVQELLRDMGGFSSFAVSFSVISILTGATQLYGYGLQHGGPIQMAVGWLLVSLLTLPVALSMAELASSYPTAGALYHWSSFLGGRTLGWFTACFNTIGMFALLAGVDYGLAQFVITLTGWPNSPAYLISLYTVVLFSHALLNHFGIRLVAWLNDFSAGYHIAVVLAILATLWSKGFVQPFHFLLTFNSTDGFKPAYSFLVGLLITQWTLTGFDASAHVTEETTNPRKNAPWGIFIAVAVSVIVGLIMLVSVTLSIADLAQATQFGDGAFVEIIRQRLGPQLGAFIISLIAGAMWLCGLSTMTSASRMVYAFARDGGLPFSGAWATVSRKHRTPSNAVWGLAFLAMVIVLSVKLYSALISIAVIALYISYGLPIFARLKYRFKNGLDEVGPWSLGKFSTPVAVSAVIWICILCVVFILPPNEQAAPGIGAFIIVLTLLWIFTVRHHFKGPHFHLAPGRSSRTGDGDELR